MPVIKYDRELLINKTLEYASINGFDDLSARKLADYIGCSVIPIYSAFKNIGVLIEETRKQIISDILANMDIEHIPDNKLVSSAIAIICYARDYEHLYREVFINHTDQEYINAITEKFHSYILSTGNSMAGELNAEEMNIYITKIWVCIQGFAAMVCSGQLKNATNEFFAEAVRETGIDILRGMLFNNGTLYKLDHYRPEMFTTEWEIINWGTK